MGTWMWSMQIMHSELQWENLMEEPEGRIRKK
jgi:hypothetical protein